MGVFSFSEITVNMPPSRQIHIDWSDLLQPLQAKFDDAQRALTRSRTFRMSTELEMDRIGTAKTRARGSVSDAKIRRDDMERRALAADRQVQQMKRRGAPRAQWNRWEAESRKWTTESEQYAKEEESSEEDVRRTENQTRALARQVRDISFQAGSYESELKFWEQRLTSVRRLTLRMTVGRPRGSLTDGLEVTTRAKTVLYQMIALSSPRAGQAMRLEPTFDGVKLSLAYLTTADKPYRHRRRVILVAESPLPRQLVGVTVDATPARRSSLLGVGVR